MKRRSLFGLFAALAQGQMPRAPIRKITQGPKFHWFGYYDKLQFDPSGRYLLGQQVEFEGRSPKADDVVRVGLIDTKDQDRWTEIGTSRAWNWQQGCMLQWLPKSKDTVMWNDRVDGQFVSHFYNIKTKKTRTVGAPIYTLSPDGKTGIAPDFRRLNDCRPGYGYAGIADPNRDRLIPEDAGIWRVDIPSGKQELIIPFSTAAAIPFPAGYSKGAKHWFNHLLYSTSGERFIFLHRWRGDKEGAGFSTRMFTADRNGKDLYVLDPHGKTSHFIWRDPEHVLAWAWHPKGGDKFFLYRDQTEEVEIVGEGIMTVNGHCTYLPGNQWILNDTYPDKERIQHAYLYHVASKKRVPVADLLSPKEYVGEWRVDLHPRFSPDGTKVCVDSTHEGLGRQMYLIDIKDLLRV
jgi:hypothetical protein